MGNEYGQGENGRKYCWRCKVCGHKSPLTAQTCENPACGVNLSMYGEPAPADLTPQEEELLLKEEEEARRREEERRKMNEELHRLEEEERKRQEEEERAQKEAQEKFLQAEQVRKIREKEEREAKERAEKIRREREREKEDERLRKEEEDRRKAEEAEKEKIRQKEEAEKEAAEQKAREEALKRSMEKGKKREQKKRKKWKAAAVLLCVVAIAAVLLYLYLTVDSISVAKEPATTTYYVGESFNLNGLRLEATYLIGRTDTIYGSFDDGITYSPSAFTYAGDVTVWIRYGGKSTSVKVTVEETKIAFSETEITLYVGDTETLKATTVPSGEKVSYSSSDSGVASVNSSGKITAEGTGTATITASMTVGSKTYEDTCKVTVSEDGSISLDQSSITLEVGDSQRLEATTAPEGEKVTYSSSDTDVASVSSMGTVTAKAVGTVTITASITIGSKTCEDTCKVTVSEGGITLDQSSITLDVGDTKTLTATTTPSGKTVSYKSSDTSVASVNSSGKVTAKAAGTATITAGMTYGGKTYEATCKVTVSNSMTTGITASKSSVTFNFADTEITEFTVSPTILYAGDSLKRSFSWSGSCDSVQISFTATGGTDSSLTVTSSDTSVVTVESVTQSGNVTTVTLKPVGQSLTLGDSNSASLTRTATVTATANDGSGETCKVAVTLNDSFSYTITSSDDSIFHYNYDSSGNIENYTIGKSGTVTLTMTSGNGNKATTKLTVIAD